MLQLVISQTDSQIQAHKEDMEYLKLMSMRWPLACKKCGRKGDLSLEEFQIHEDECRR